MKKFGIFTFESFSFDEKILKASFYYSFDNWDEVFKEIIDFKSDKFKLPENSPFFKEGKWNAIKDEEIVILNNFLFNLHIALWISYYKLFPTKNLEVKSWYLDQDQISFWEKFYKNWLWEFFIKNDINFSELINFKNIWSVPNIEKTNLINNYIQKSDCQQGGFSPLKNLDNIEILHSKKSEKNLLLWWGWKDSIASYSILKKEEELINNTDLFVFWKIDDIKKNTAKIAEKEILLVKRQLSNNLFKLNKEWYYNWHVPITWIIAFVTFVVAYIYWYSNIILSNEKSASEENTIWKWLKINHQYSKSIEFEKDLNKYLQNYISKWINYFSLLRWMYEYKIAEIFSKEKKFFWNFSSCNRNFKINKSPLLDKEGQGGGLWCCKCEKCCFVFLILSPFLEEKELIKIFWENLFDKTSLEKTFRELIWLENYKPFECVWTYEESLLSAKKIIKKNKQGDLAPCILKNIKSDVLKKCNEKTEKKLENKLSKISNEDIIPKRFKKILKWEINKKIINI